MLANEFTGSQCKLSLGSTLCVTKTSDECTCEGAGDLHVTQRNKRPSQVNLCINVDNPYSGTFLIGHLHLCGMRFGVAPRADTKLACLKGTGLRAQIMISNNHYRLNSQHSYYSCVSHTVTPKQVRHLANDFFIFLKK